MTALRDPRSIELRREFAETSNRTKVMCAVLRRQALAGRATIRTVADEAGLSISVTYKHLNALHGMGLVTWEDGARGTLRASVAIVVPRVE